MLPALATTDDATGYGYTLPDTTGAALLARASARIRRAAAQTITSTTVTLTLEPRREEEHFAGRWAGREHVVLPSPPITAVEQVLTVPTDGTQPQPIEGWAWDGEERVWLPWGTGRVAVTYTRGFDPVPDGLVELCCEVAYRLGQTPDGEGLIRQQSVDDYSVTFATEQIVAGGDLMPGELAALQRLLGSPRALMVRSRD